jgi:two-component system phosphate regulon sensor histidine kinase PhoR
VLCVLVVALSAVDILASRATEKTYVRVLTRELEDKARMVAITLPDAPTIEPAWLTGLAKAAGGRLTVVGRDGRVLADSEANAGQMENHAGRPEIVAALRGLTGADSRTSSTMGVKFLYVGVPVKAGALRIAVPLSDVERQVTAIRRQLLTAVALAFLPAILVAAFFARYVSSKLATIIDYAGRLARGDFRARLGKGGRDELGILTEQLNETGEKLQKMFEQLQHEQVELQNVDRIR